MRFVALLPLAFCLSAAMASPPVVTPDSATMKLDEIGLYDVGYRYRGASDRRMPVGWTGFFDDRTGIACEPYGVQDGKTAFLLHCAWRNGVGCAFQDYALKLPRSRKIRLTGAVAMKRDVVKESDGVVFRVYVAGRKVVEEFRDDAVWKPFRVDLTPYAGKTVVVRFETDPGPKDNSSYDYSFWGDRTVRIDGFHATPVRHAAAPALNLKAMCSKQSASVVPPCCVPGVRVIRSVGGGVELRYTAGRETLVYTWTAPKTDNDPPLGTVSLRASLKGGDTFAVPVARGALIHWGEGVEPASAGTLRLDHGQAVMTRTYRTPSGRVTFKAVGKLVGKSLVMDVSCDQPEIANLDAGGFGPVLRRRNVTIPYYSGQVFYLPKEDLFVNTFLDWTYSNASSHDGARAIYNILTDGKRVPLKERVVFAASWNLAEVLPNVPNPPSPYRAEMGKRMVLDTWGGRYTDIAHGFEQLVDYGVRDCYAIIHDWQRSGYDNALPMHVPAAADKGGDEGMKTLVQTGVRLGYRVALHENYVDYYPNYDFFNENDISLLPDGTKMNAWYNPGTRIQSFAVKPTAILRLAKTQSPDIHARYGTNANYLDVHSAVPPWFHVDNRVSEPGAGMFSTVWQAHRDLWAFERATHGGPVTGEGANHWYWSGLLDAAEAQFGVGWPGNQGMAAPLMVDFDLLRIHPLAINHGMGYYERWWAQPKWGNPPPMTVLDQYRMQEVAYGHAPFLGGSVWNNIPVAWLEHHLVTPVSERYGVSAPSDIRYEVGGKWVDSTAAAKAASWDRLRVRYANGLTITANNSAKPMTVGSVTLPRFGWCASGAGVRAYTGKRGNAIVDYAETARSVFANARNDQDWFFTAMKRVRPSVSVFEQTGPRSFRATYHWKVGSRLSEDYNCFVHFSDVGKGFDPYSENIRFQGDHAPSLPCSAWAEGSVVNDGPHNVSIPDDVKDGDYVWCTGLVAPGGGARLGIEGPDDGHGRVILGLIHVRDNGATITFTPEQRSGEERVAIYAAGINSKPGVVDFGTVRTDGSVLVERDGGDWVLRALPRDRAFRVALLASRFGKPTVIRARDGDQDTVKPSVSGAWLTLPLNGASEYRWKAK